jgi:hypothetical protein
MKIGQLAQQTGTPVDTIRYYEREGLLRVPRERKATTGSMMPFILNVWPSFGGVAPST